MVNPFQIPETTRGIGPLCPWLVTEHREFYVNLERARRSFDDFRCRLEQLHGGLLVIAHGEKGCGKTSLIHQCADYADRVLNQSENYNLGEFIVDLSQYEYSSDTTSSTANRMKEIANETKRSLQDRGRVPCPDIPHDETYEPLYRRLYRAISQRAKTIGFTLIIILPQVEDYIENLREYRHLAKNNPHIIFFTESSYVDVIRTFLAEGFSRNPAILSLTVEPLSPDECHRLVEDRIGRHGTGSVARIKNEDLDNFIHIMGTIDLISITRIISILYETWEKHHDQPPGWITLNDLITSLAPDLKYR